MYLVTDHHAPIVDRDTYNRVQQELARRTSKRKSVITPKLSKANTAENMRYPSC